MFTEVPRDQQAKLSQEVTFYCSASGNPQPRIQWYKDGSLLEGKTENVLLFKEVAVSDRGFYHCTASNTEGEVTSDRATLSLTDIVQYVVPILIPIPGTGRFKDLTGEDEAEVHAAVLAYVEDMNSLGQTVQVVGSSSHTLEIYTIAIAGDSISTSLILE